MTYAPPSLLAARQLLLEHLDMHAGRTVTADLDPAEVGVVGDPGHAATGSSYHLGKDQLRGNSYSITESGRDRRGLTNAASALDVGDFTVVGRGGKRHDLRSMSIWIVAQCKAGTPDTADIREVIYSPDGRSVKRWDRLGLRSGGDDSHLFHTHLSYFRDSEHHDKTALFRRYLTEIGLLEDPVDAADVWVVDGLLDNPAWRADATTNPFITPKTALIVAMNEAHAANVNATKALAVATGLANKDDVDEPAIIAGVLAGLDPARIPDDLAQQLADLLAARLAA